MKNESICMTVNFISVNEFAQRIKMHPQTVRKAIKQGTIFATRIFNGKKQGHYRIAESELERLQLQAMCERK